MSDETRTMMESVTSRANVSPDARRAGALHEQMYEHILKNSHRCIADDPYETIDGSLGDLRNRSNPALGFVSDSHFARN